MILESQRGDDPIKSVWKGNLRTFICSRSLSIIKRHSKEFIRRIGGTDILEGFFGSDFAGRVILGSKYIFILTLSLVLILHMICFNNLYY